MPDNELIERPAGDHGTGEAAIEFHLALADEPHSDFLYAWTHGDLDEWPEYHKWLSKRALSNPPPSPGVEDVERELLLERAVIVCDALEADSKNDPYRPTMVDGWHVMRELIAALSPPSEQEGDATAVPPDEAVVEATQRFVDELYNQSCGHLRPDCGCDALCEPWGDMPPHRQTSYANAMRAALSTLNPRRPAAGTIMLEMAAADDAHRMWERRWHALEQMYAIDRCFADQDGKWGLRDFLDYAASACGFINPATAAPDRSEI